MDKIATVRNIRQDIFNGEFGCTKVPCLESQMFRSLECPTCHFSFCVYEHAAAFAGIKNYMPIILEEE